MNIRPWLGTAGLAAVAAVAVSIMPASGSTNASAGCFGHRGVQFGSNNAYECIYQPQGNPGALYWQRNNSDYAWNKHPSSGLLVVNAITTRISPENNYYGFIVVIASSEGGCKVNGAGYDRHPTTCNNPGRSPKIMSRRQQLSYDSFAEDMNRGIPDCAWMPDNTIPSKTC